MCWSAQTHQHIKCYLCPDSFCHQTAQHEVSYSLRGRWQLLFNVCKDNNFPPPISQWTSKWWNNFMCSDPKTLNFVKHRLFLANQMWFTTLSIFYQALGPYPWWYANTGCKTEWFLVSALFRIFFIISGCFLVKDAVPSLVIHRNLFPNQAHWTQTVLNMSSVLYSGTEVSLKK